MLNNIIQMIASAEATLASELTIKMEKGSRDLHIMFRGNKISCSRDLGKGIYRKS